MQTICTLLQIYNHANTSPLRFLQAGCPSCHPTNSVKAVKDHPKPNRKHIYQVVLQSQLDHTFNISTCRTVQKQFEVLCENHGRLTRYWHQRDKVKAATSLLSEYYNYNQLTALWTFPGKTWVSRYQKKHSEVRQKQISVCQCWHC